MNTQVLSNRFVLICQPQMSEGSRIYPRLPKTGQRLHHFKVELAPLLPAAAPEASLGHQDPLYGQSVVIASYASATVSKLLGDLNLT